MVTRETEIDIPLVNPGDSIKSEHTNLIIAKLNAITEHLAQQETAIANTNTRISTVSTKVNTIEERVSALEGGS